MWIFWSLPCCCWQLADNKWWFSILFFSQNNASSKDCFQSWGTRHNYDLSSSSTLFAKLWLIFLFVTEDLSNSKAENSTSKTQGWEDSGENYPTNYQISSLTSLLGPVNQNLTKLLANVTLKFPSWNMANILIFFAEKMWVAFALQKLLTLMQQKYQSIWKYFSYNT